MGEFTLVQWCDCTRNKWIGCTKVRPECDTCYAKFSTPARTNRILWGPGQPRYLTGPGTRKDMQRWENQHEQFFAKHGRRRRVFMGSLMDPFDNEVPDVWHEEYAQECLQTPHLDKIVLTKRIGNVSRMVPRSWLEPGGWPSHVWLGISAGTQQSYDLMLHKLLALAVPVSILSMEPLLEDVDMGLGRGWCRHCRTFTAGTVDGHCMDPASPCFAAETTVGSMLGWVITGGESDTPEGKGRPMDVRWARSVVRQTRLAGVPTFVKQLGSNPQGWCAAQARAEDGGDQAGMEEGGSDCFEAHECSKPCAAGCALLNHPKGGDPEEWPHDLRVREFPAPQWVPETA